MSDTHSHVIELLRAESAAIAKAASRLRPDDIEPAIDLLANCKGKVIVLGVGVPPVVDDEKKCVGLIRAKRVVSRKLGTHASGVPSKY
jgi:hypothetical protein